MKFPSRQLFLTGLSRVIAAAVILGLGVGGFMALVASKPEVASRPRSEEVRKVAVTIADHVSANPMQQAFGTVSAAQVSDLRFAIGGEVASINPITRNGSLVRKGQVLARLDTELLELSANDIAVQLAAENDNQIELKSQLALRQRQFDRVNQMKAASVASEKRLDDAQLALSQAKNSLTQSSSRILQFEIAKKRADRNLRDAVLKAPFDGVLANVMIGTGQVLSSNTALGKITDLNSLEVSFVVPAETYAISNQLMGQDVAITWTAGGRDVVTVTGQIKRVEGNVNANEGGGRLYATLPAVKTGQMPTIPAGAFVEIMYPTLPLEDVVILPEEAIFDRENVFVIIEGRANRRKVEILSKSNGLIYVRGALNNGDQVVSTRIPGLAQGTLVQIVGSSQKASAANNGTGS